MEGHDRIDAGNFEESPNRLLLGGYLGMTDAGFAVPCFGVSRLPNQWYVAACDPAGDPEGKVTGFTPSEITGVRALDDNAMRSVGIGDPWVDVFVWEGRPYIGTRAELWATLAPLRGAIGKLAPLSALDLAFGAETEVRAKYSRAGARFVRERYGDAHARNWQRQVARTRFLTRLRQAGIQHEPERFEFLGKGPKGRLVIQQEDWIDLPEDVRETLMRAAKATGEELGLSVDFRASFTRSSRGRKEHDAPRQEALKRIVEQHLPRHQAVNLSVLLLPVGRRAVRIAGAAKTLDWTPTWSESGGFHTEIIGKGHSAELSWLPWIEVCSLREGPISNGYGVVVLLVDDEIGMKADGLPELLYMARDLASKNGVVILAPALPEDAPSKLLSGNLPDFGFNADLVLDTSLARSPMWGVSDRLSLDRRITDLILTTADACLPGSRIYQSIQGHRGLSRIPRVANLALWRPEGFSDAYDGAGALVSECNRPYLPKAWIDEPIPLRSGKSAPPAARLVVGELNPDFPHYAQSVLMLRDNQNRSRSSSQGPRFERDHMRLSLELRQSLTFPSAAAGFEDSERRRGGLALVAETPTIETLELARQEDVVVARVTDASGIRRLSQREARKGRIPTEVSLPPLKRFAANRRLATRGVDPRDVIRVPIRSDLGEAMRRHPEIAGQVRTYLPGADIVPDELAVPVDFLEALAPADEIASALLARYLGKAPTGRRLADLAVLWRPPVINRYLIQDSVLPSKVLEFDGDSEAPAQTCFVIDGDEAVPLLFGSSLFSVWARLTRSRGMGWAKRFSLTRTFETFPILHPFYTAALHPQSVPTATLYLTLESPEFSGIADYLAVQNIDDADYRQSHEKYLSARAEGDERLLELYGLAPDSSELTIARRLLELNAQRAGGPEIG